MHVCAMMLRMAAIPGRIRRDPDGGAGFKLLQGRVPPAIHRRAHRGAAARNVSVSLYLEMLVAADELAGLIETPTQAAEQGQIPQLELPQVSGL